MPFSLAAGRSILSTPRPKRPIALHLVSCSQDVARELGVGHQDGVGILGDGEDVVGAGALRHAEGRVEPRQRRLGQIERGKHAIGDSNHRAGHGKLRSQAGEGKRAKPTPAKLARPPAENMTYINDLPAALTKH